MARGRRRFERKTGKRAYKKLFAIAVGGGKTEPQYFQFFNLTQSLVRVQCLAKGKDYSPKAVIRRMERFIRQTDLRKSDEVWLVVDKDEWTDEQLKMMLDWTCKKDDRAFALSNPKFEFWLLLHFEDGKGVTSSRQCTDRLKKHLPGFDKGVDAGRFPPEVIKKAVERAKTRDVPPCEDWPQTTGTTVYRLIERIFDAEARYSSD